MMIELENQYRHYLRDLKVSLGKDKFDRLVYLHPKLKPQIDVLFDNYNNSILKEESIKNIK